MKRVNAALMILVLVLAAGCGLNGSSATPLPKDAASQISCPVPQEIQDVSKEGLKANGYIMAQVTRVVDGDTMEVKYRKSAYKVRLLDVDTPESVKKGVAVQPYGKEASQYTSSLVLNKQVKLVFEKGLRDKYGRLLAHMIREDGAYVNGLLVRNGYARVEVLKPNTAYKDFFNTLQQAAVQASAGLWRMDEKERPFVKNDEGEYVPRYWK